MWNLFGHKNQEEQSIIKDVKPDLDLLNGHCYECDYCEAIHSLIGKQPLSILKCDECGSPTFVPYRVKDYWLYLPLGGGGMGSVYKAIHADNPDSEFAVKLLPRQKKDDPHLIESLLKEAAIGKTFGKHPHLIAVADYGKSNDEYFAALEYCDGTRLDQIIEMPEQVNQKYILLWTLQILSAEQRIYDAGYLYRDLKPQNIMVDKAKNARLFDFGLCITIEESKNADSDMVDGSPLYMPPERIVGLEENMSSEIYSLGMVLFHALTRKTYYTATGAFELAKKHVTSLRTTSVKQKLPIFVNPLIADVLDKMLARTPARRFQTFKEVAEAIKAVYNKL